MFGRCTWDDIYLSSEKSVQGGGEQEDTIKLKEPTCVRLSHHDLVLRSIYLGETEESGVYHGYTAR